MGMVGRRSGRTEDRGQESGCWFFTPKGWLSIARWRKPLDKATKSIVFFALKGRLYATTYNRPFRAKNQEKKRVGLVVLSRG
jgi:hypothetical protein